MVFRYCDERGEVSEASNPNGAIDETSIPSVALGQKARVHIDAYPNRTFDGTVTEVGNSPITATRPRKARSAAGASPWASATRARSKCASGTYTACTSQPGRPSPAVVH